MTNLREFSFTDISLVAVEPRPVGELNHRLCGSVVGKSTLDERQVCRRRLDKLFRGRRREVSRICLDVPDRPDAVIVTRPDVGFYFPRLEG